MNLRKITISLAGKMEDHGPVFEPAPTPQSLERYRYNPEQPRDKMGRFASMATQHGEKAASLKTGERQRHLATQHAANAAKAIHGGQDAKGHLDKMYAAVTALRIQGHHARQGGKDASEHEKVHEHYHQLYRQLVAASKGKGEVPEVSHYGQPAPTAGSDATPPTPKEEAPPHEADPAPEGDHLKRATDLRHQAIQGGHPGSIKATGHLTDAASHFQKGDALEGTGAIRAARKAHDQVDVSQLTSEQKKHHRQTGKLLSEMEEKHGTGGNGMEHMHAEMSAEARHLPVNKSTPFQTMQDTKSRDSLTAAHQHLAHGHQLAAEGKLDEAEHHLDQARDKLGQVPVTPKAHGGVKHQAVKGVDALHTHLEALRAMQGKQSPTPAPEPTPAPPAPETAERFPAKHPGVQTPLTGTDAHLLTSGLQAHKAEDLSPKAQRVMAHVKLAGKATEQASAFKDPHQGRAARMVALAHASQATELLQKTHVTKQADKAALRDAADATSKLLGHHNPESLKNGHPVHTALGGLKDALKLPAGEGQDKGSRNSLVQAHAHHVAAQDALAAGDRNAASEHLRRAERHLTHVGDTHGTQKAQLSGQLTSLKGQLSPPIPDEQEHRDMNRLGQDSLNHHPADLKNHAVQAARRLIAHAANWAHHKVTGQGDPEKIKEGLKSAGQDLLHVGKGVMHEGLKVAVHHAVNYLNKHHPDLKLHLPSPLPNMDVSHHTQQLHDLHSAVHQDQGAEHQENRQKATQAHQGLQDAARLMQAGKHTEALSKLHEAKGHLDNMDDLNGHHQQVEKDLRHQHDQLTQALTQHAVQGNTPEHHQLAAALAEHHKLPVLSEIHQHLAAGNKAKALQLMEKHNAQLEKIQKSVQKGASNGRHKARAHGFNALLDHAKRNVTG